MFKKMLFSYFAMLLVTWGGSVAMASTKKLDDDVISALKLSTFSFTEQDRLNLAKQAAVYWKNFNSRVPRNSPDDKEWLSQELSSTDNKRVYLALSSKQYALSKLDFMGTNCLILFQDLSDSIGKNKVTEAYFWLKTTQCYANINDTLHYLKISGLSNGRSNGEFSIEHFSLLMGQLSGKISNSLIDE